MEKKTRKVQNIPGGYNLSCGMPPCPIIEEEYKEPDSWTIITALDRLLSLAEDSRLSEQFWESCKNPLAYLRERLGLTNFQLVVLAFMIEEGEAITWKRLGKFFALSRLSMMGYSDEIEELIDKRWLIRKGVRELGGCYQGFALVRGVITALRHNTTYVPEKIDGLTEQQFVDLLERHIRSHINNPRYEFESDEEWMMMLVKANQQLPLCQEVMKLNDLHEQSLLLMIVFDYAQFADTENEGLHLSFIDDLYADELVCGSLEFELKTGSHVLFEMGLIEHKCNDGIVDTECFRLTRKAKSELLSCFTPRKNNKGNRDSRFLKSHTTIKEKTLFFNASEQHQIDRLTDLLSVENLPSVQQRLEEQGLRKGFACLFYGAPGTGKTETVLQIARQTGRDLMQVDIAGLRDKFVGESEKNIQQIFTAYRNLCKNSEVMPILFFNEADAIINKRTENVEHSVDKMDNAMQNIILQEIENLEGILIATTNLTSNLDKAFERRFLFKVEFHKPETEVKAKIWSSMLKGLSNEDTLRLASRFDFSGGQIENIARKRTIDYILTGKQATLQEIEDYCMTELLDSKNIRKHIAGFSL